MLYAYQFRQSLGAVFLFGVKEEMRTGIAKLLGEFLLTALVLQKKDKYDNLIDRLRHKKENRMNIWRIKIEYKEMTWK